jgi:hypothetical protein
MYLVATLLSFLTARAAAQTVFLSEPTVLWQTAVSPVGEGNECALSPTSIPTLVCSAIDGSATGLQPDSATMSGIIWNYKPDLVGTTMSSTSGVTFSSTGSWFVYWNNRCHQHSVDMVRCNRGGQHDISGKSKSVSPLILSHLVQLSAYQPCSCGVCCQWNSSVGFGITRRSMFRNASCFWKRRLCLFTHNGIISSNFTVLDATDGTIFYQEAISTSLLLSLRESTSTLLEVTTPQEQVIRTI